MPIESISIQEPVQETTLKDYFYIILKRKNIVISFFAVIAAIAAIGNITSPDLYMASSQVLIQDPMKPLTDMPEAQGVSFGMEYLNTQIEIMKSISVASAVVEKLDLVSKYPKAFGQSPKEAAKRIKGMISIKQVGDSRVFYVIAKSTNPNLSAEVVNALVDVYVEKNVIASFLMSKDLVAKWFPEEDTGRLKIETIYGKLKGLSRDEIIQSLPSVATNMKIIELKSKKGKLEQDLARYATKYTERYPKVINAKKELQLIKDEMKNATEAIVNEIKDMVGGKFQTSNIKIIEYADVPQAPVGPKRMRNFILAAVMALFVGCGLAIFVDNLDNTVKTQEDVERHIRLPYLGYVPLMSIKDYIIVDPNEHKSSLMEALRNIRTSIIFSSPPDTLKSILITSAIPQEGKSTISINLAIAIAADGTRTLLVDGDMRRPSLHKILGLNNSSGLSNYLTSKMPIDDIIQETKFQNLKFISCGPIPPNPSELFGSYRMKELLNEAKAKFDRVLFDGAPIFGISDSVVLAKALDGVIQVIRFGKISWDMVNKAKNRLQNLGVKITGVIINGVDIKKESYYYKYYDYTYHKYYE
ncbi:MAG: polysaccharide biosynthesis tyrosine autokinase [Candidatus Omnitrophica bacterium]|nr:polysaccharide biosynthesis tyrosine autokinase [Candidatus Omnitrophota bacterium]